MTKQLVLQYQTPKGGWSQFCCDTEPTSEPRLVSKLKALFYRKITAELYLVIRDATGKEIRRELSGGVCLDYDNEWTWYYYRGDFEAPQKEN